MLKTKIFCQSTHSFAKGLVFLLIFAVFGLINSAPTFAEAKQSTLSLSVTNSDLLVELTPSATGSFGKSNSSTIRVRTDNFTGYNLTILTDGNTALSNGAGNEITSIEEAVSESTFSTSGAYNNTWGYRPNQYMNGGQVVENTNFLPVPGSSGDLIDETAAANSTDKTYTLDFGARVDFDTIPGTYTNSLTIVALANDVVYNINYDENTTDEVDNMPSPNPQVIEIEGGTATPQSIATLSDATPTRNGYQFGGWCDVETTLDSSTGNQTCSGDTYVAGADYGIDQTEDGSNIKLYAIWTVNPLPTMQEQTTLSLSAVMSNDGDSVTLRDGRDDKNYEVTKINGDYWMTQNLRFTGTSLDPSTSNVASATTITYGDLTSGNSYTEARIHEGVDSNGDPTVWYNFAAASAMTITGDSNDTDAIYDICPKGWRLPTNSELGSITPYMNAFSPVAGGYYHSASTFNSTYGYWWSATSSSTTRRFYRTWNGSVFGAGFNGVDDYDRRDGFYVRCIYGPVINAMQEQTVSSLSAAMPNEGDSVTLRDSRDDKKYEITKINGDYWMTQNLRFTGRTLDPSTSNVASATAITYYEDLTDGDSFDEARIHIGIDGNGDPTVWYNYAAATAMTITGNNNSSEALNDICPKGWRLPTEAQLNNIVSYAEDFNSVSGGGYFNGELNNPSYGHWWSATPSGQEHNTHRYYLFTAGGFTLENGFELALNAWTRGAGFYVRCVKSALPTMQEQTSASLNAAMPNNGDRTTLRDSRDEKRYEITKINGQYWMTQNLRFTDIYLNPSTSNVASTTNITYGDLTDGYSYDEARIHTGVDNKGRPTVWYNFAAASAMTITGSSNNAKTTYDICPVGWRLPTRSEVNEIISYEDAFSPVTGGYYNGSGTLYGSSEGHWWSATAADATNRYYLGMFSGGLGVYGSDRSNGKYVRCIKSS